MFEKVFKVVSVLLLIVSLTTMTTTLVIWAVDTNNQEEEVWQNLENMFVEYNNSVSLDEGISWQEGQALPKFAKPADTLKVIYTYEGDGMNPDDRLCFASLQGLVNMVKPVILLGEKDTIRDVWPHTFGFSLIDYTPKMFDLFKEHKDSIKGIVLYDPEISEHYRNVASTLGGIYGYLPVTEGLYERLKEQGVTIDDDNIVDVTTWTEKSAIDIYNKLYNDYWNLCSKRLIVLANPVTPKLDLDHCRDMAIAVKAAVIFLDTENNDAEIELYEKFIKDMADAEDTSIILGWGITERSAVTHASKFGVGLVPADFFISASVYSGMESIIDIPTVPKRAAVDTQKVYIASFFSDGDNIQYVQGAMRAFWDEDKDNRGQVPITWTISPSLVDIAPAIMNFYYNEASPYECFATGPSGIAYMMATNTERGKHGGIFLDDPTYSKQYAQLTGAYLQKAGLRVITMWDGAERVVRRALEHNARYLWGATVQQFDVNFSIPLITSSVENNRVLFNLLNVCYDGTLSTFTNNAIPKINIWKESNNDKPLFLSYQFNKWYAKTQMVIDFESQLKAAYGDTIEFVRADHYFSLYNEQNGLPFNILGLNTVTVEASTDNTNANNSFDGTPKTMWTSNQDKATLTYNLGREYDISRYVINHAGLYNMDNSSNTKSWQVEYSLDGINWQFMDKYINNTAPCTDIQLNSAIRAKYVRFIFTDKGQADMFRIADIELYGSVA